MASGIVFSESFDWANTAADLDAVTGKWASVGTATLSSAVGRGGTKGLQFVSANNTGRAADLLLDQNYSELCTGLAFNPASITADQPIVSFIDGATVQVDVRIDSTGALTITRNGTVIAGPTSFLMVPGSGFHYMWFRALIHNTLGSVNLIVDGQQLLSATSVDTQASANARINQYTLSTSSNINRTVAYDDIVIIDCSVNPVNKLFNDIQVGYLKPNAAGFHTAATPVGAATIHETLDELSPDGDTSYSEFAAVNDTASVGLTDPAAVSGTIVTVIPYHISRKTDAGDGSLQEGLRQDDTDDLGTDQPLLITYGHYKGSNHDLAPDGGAWDYTKLTDTELVLKRTA